jgi:hypothetical protein
MNFLTTVTIEHDSGLPEDRVVNDFAWVASDLAALQLDTTAGIPAFYNVAHAPAADPLSFWLSPRLDTTANRCKVRYYNITGFESGAPHGSPIAIESFTLNGGAVANALPEEVAAVISWHADLTGAPEEVGATRPAARRRGRAYIGPLNVQGVGTDARITTPFMNSLHGAGLFFLTLPGGHFSIWSRADAVLRPAVGGFNDNAFDTQRRRGTDATLRQVW